MANVIYLEQQANRPDLTDQDSWIYIDEEDGKFLGTGGAWRSTGEWVGYGSLSSNDASLHLALEAAQEWAERHNVPNIWVFSGFSDSNY